MPIDTSNGPFELTPELEARLYPLLEDHEGRVRYIYPDSAGNPTVGVGHLLIDAQAACKLPFVRSSDMMRASAGEIEHVWDTVRLTRKPDITLFLQPKIIDNTLKADVIDCQWKLKRNFGTTLEIPLAAVIGLYDMMFNIGTLVAFPKLKTAIKMGDYNLAANESKRTGIGDGRNQRTRLLFLEACDAANGVEA